MGFFDDLAKTIASPPEKPRAQSQSKPTISAPVTTPAVKPYTPKFGIMVDMPEPTAGVDIYKLPKGSELKLKDYYVLDVETTGLDRRRDRIIEIAWLKVQNDIVVDHYVTLVNPERPISPSASCVNGICDCDVANAPKYEDIREKVKSELVGATVVGHNVTFDLDFVKYLLGDLEGRILYADTLTLAKRAFPGQASYKLENLCKSLYLSQQSSHRALQDVASTKELFDACILELRRKQAEEKAARKAEKEADQQDRQKRYGKSPLFDVSFVYTGEFGMDRAAMEELARSVGAVTRNAVTSKTDYLVVGKIANLPEWARERKLGKADELIAKGCKVKKISKAQYLDMIAEAERAMRM